MGKLEGVIREGGKKSRKRREGRATYSKHFQNSASMLKFDTLVHWSNPRWRTEPEF